MAETTLTELRQTDSGWPEPVRMADRFLEPLRLTMDVIEQQEGAFANLGEFDAANCDQAIRQGDWFKMIRWTLGYHRGAAVTPQVQQEIINAHAAHHRGGSATLATPLYPGTIMAHFGALATPGTEACSDGHTKLTDYAMRWFVENGKSRAALSWQDMHALFVHIRDQAADASNAREGLEWINAMLAWMAVMPAFRKADPWECAAVLWRMDYRKLFTDEYFATMSDSHKLRRTSILANLNVNDLVMGLGNSGTGYDRVWYKPGPRAVACSHFNVAGPFTHFMGPGLVTTVQSIEELVTEHANKLEFLPYDSNRHHPEVADDPVRRLSFGSYESQRPEGYTQHSGIILRALTPEEKSRVEPVFNGLSAITMQGLSDVGYAANPGQTEEAA